MNINNNNSVFASAELLLFADFRHYTNYILFRLAKNIKFEFIKYSSTLFGLGWTYYLYLSKFAYFFHLFLLQFGVRFRFQFCMYEVWSKKYLIKCMFCQHKFSTNLILWTGSILYAASLPQSIWPNQRFFFAHSFTGLMTLCVL